MNPNPKPFLSPEWIDPQALEIVRRLQGRGHTAFLVGGCIRDLLCGVVPKDYDIGTTAEPNQVRRIVPGSYVIGRRFRLVLVKRGDHQFEVATFRRESAPEDTAEGEEAPVGDNLFGTPEEDARRRDFTANSLFYDPIKAELIDFCGGKQDIDQRILKMIGDPKVRITEDPIRTLRALRFAHKLHFRLDSDLRAAIQELGPEMFKAILPRKREEYLKILRLDDPARVFLELEDLGLLPFLFPTLHGLFQESSRRDTFLEFLHRVHDFAKYPSQAVDLYVPVILGFREAAKDSEWAKKEEDFLRNELGVFRAEQGEIEALFELRNRLDEIELFKRRGARRQQAFLENSLLPKALRLAEFDHHLTAEQLAFWHHRLFAWPET